MNAISNRTSSSSVVSMLGRLLVSYALLGAISAAKFSEAASTAAATGEPSEQFGKCSLEQVQHTLDSATSEAKRAEVANQLYEQCNAEFLALNSIDDEVKETVDTWLEMDLSKADIQDLFSAYQKALMNPNPLGQVSDNFNKGCKRMLVSFEKLRDISTSLYDYVRIDNEALLAGEGSINDDERAILDFAMYTQICDSMMGWFGGQA